MPIHGIGGATGAQSAAPQLGQLGGETFLKLLVAQLRYQNPMQPTDGSAMLQQTAQFTQVETLQQLASAQKELLATQHAGIASGFVGKEVTVVDADGVETTGVVEALRFTNEGPLLLLGGREFPLDAAREIRIAGDAGTTSPSA
jgi:flagellar basal-body rod modification protein FlgD